MKIRFIAITFIALLASQLACGDSDENYIEGSLTKSYDFDFESTRVRLYTGELSIEYVAEENGAEKVALRITISRSGDALINHRPYDLLTQGTLGRGAGYLGELPELSSGVIELDQYGEDAGSAVQGTFEAVFTTAENSKQTLRGGFAAKLEIIDF